MNRIALSASLVFIGMMFLATAACRKSSDRPQYPAGSNESINSWVLDSMRVYYYWNNSLPASPALNQDPGIFFNGLKNKADRFSALVNPDIPSSYPASLVHTLGFDMVTLQFSNGSVETMVSLVVPGSRAADTGLQRGDIIKTINGTAPAANNIAGLTARIITDGTALLELAGRAGTIRVSTLISDEAPVYIHKVFQSGSKTYGYLFLNSFGESGLSELEAAFSDFKAQQVQELLLDLRYNPGGSVAVAASVAVMLAGNATAGSTFVEYRGNTHAGTIKSSFANEIARLPAAVRKNFSQFAGYRLGLNRVYLLSGSHTASAAELLINALKPYLTVIQVGTQSLGKDMASFAIKDYRNPQVVPQWEIYPMIFKLYNAAGNGNYPDGLVPDQQVDEFSLLPLKPFGDPGDPLVQRCLAADGGGVLAGVRQKSVERNPVLVFDSRDKVDGSAFGQMTWRP